MRAFVYGLGLQWVLDVRGKALLITCYLLPALFGGVLGAVFTNVMPESVYTLIPTMIIISVTMVSAVGLPQLLLETYGTDVKSSYKANGVPLSVGVFTHFISAFVHTMIMSGIFILLLPRLFGAVMPENLPLFFGGLAAYTAVSLALGCFLGVLVKNSSRMSIVSQLVLLPSMMLSGAMFPLDMLPRPMEYAAMVLPATLGNFAMNSETFPPWIFAGLGGMMVIFAIGCGVALSRAVKE